MVGMISLRTPDQPTSRASRRCRAYTFRLSCVWSSGVDRSRLIIWPVNQGFDDDADTASSVERERMALVNAE